MRTIALIHDKDGNGKTTCALNIGYGLAMQKKKVLLVDLDPRAHLTLSTGMEIKNTKRSMTNVLLKKISINEIIKKIAPNLYIAPSDIGLAINKNSFDYFTRSFYGLGLRFNVLKSYDFVIFDCESPIGGMVYNALTYVHEIFLPIQLKDVSIKNMIFKLREAIEAFKESYKNEAKITGVIITMYNPKSPVNEHAAKQIKEMFPANIFKTYIRKDNALAEAQIHCKSIFEYHRQSNGAQDFDALVREILAQKTI